MLRRDGGHAHFRVAPNAGRRKWRRLPERRRHQSLRGRRRVGV